MNININQPIRSAGTKNRLIPLRVAHVTVLGTESWLVFQPFGDCVKTLFPCHWYTSVEAINEYCARNDINVENVVMKVEVA